MKRKTIATVLGLALLLAAISLSALTESGSKSTNVVPGIIVKPVSTLTDLVTTTDVGEWIEQYYASNPRKGYIWANGTVTYLDDDTPTDLLSIEVVIGGKAGAPDSEPISESSGRASSQPAQRDQVPAQPAQAPFTINTKIGKEPAIVYDLLRVFHEKKASEIISVGNLKDTASLVDLLTAKAKGFTAGIQSLTLKPTVVMKSKGSRTIRVFVGYIADQTTAVDGIQWEDLGPVSIDEEQNFLTAFITENQQQKMTESLYVRFAVVFDE